MIRLFSVFNIFLLIRQFLDKTYNNLYNILRFINLYDIKNKLDFNINCLHPMQGEGFLILISTI